MSTAWKTSDTQTYRGGPGLKLRPRESGSDCHRSGSLSEYRDADSETLTLKPESSLNSDRRRASRWP